jgi:PASTA domain
MVFPLIRSASDPEDYSWEVLLDQGQELKSVDERHAAVYYEDGEHTAFGITAEDAHDADGSTVPTSLTVSEGRILTLTVHHRLGNSVEGGAPFVYPIVPGPGFEKGFESVTTYIPPAKSESVDSQEAISHDSCIVPLLRGETLKASKRELGEARCRIGAVRKRKGVTVKGGRVVEQSPKPGRLLAPRAEVSVVLGASSLRRG